MSASMEPFRMPRYREPPDARSYMDQTVKHINRFLSPPGCVAITSSTMSSDAKKGFVQSPERKQYDAEQIAHLFFIAITKSVLRSTITAAAHIIYLNSRFEVLASAGSDQ